MYRKVLLAYDGSIEERRGVAGWSENRPTLHFLLAVVEVSAGSGTLDDGFLIPLTKQVEV